ncbi:hypothetical protein T261_5855 [Streptomyces lydicus]|nr:hypothetical protein T261_5855 [Streptomyces lydicus]
MRRTYAAALPVCAPDLKPNSAHASGSSGKMIRHRHRRAPAHTACTARQQPSDSASCQHIPSEVP